MQMFIGTKALNAKPMTRGEYCTLRGWGVPSNEDPTDLGYLVEYLDGGAANHPDFDGYISWSPEAVFRSSYRIDGQLTFGDAVFLMRNGMKLARTGWNGKGMFVFIVPGSEFKVNRAPLLGIYPEGTDIRYREHMDMRSADGSIVVWTVSQSDALANDWCIVK